jgi:hypothetical protein
MWPLPLIEDIEQSEKDDGEKAEFQVQAGRDIENKDDAKMMFLEGFENNHPEYKLKKPHNLSRHMSCNFSLWKGVKKFFSREASRELE